MVAKEGFCNYHNFNPIWVQHALINVKKYWSSSQKRYRYLSRYLEKFIRSRSWSRRRNSDLQLSGAGAERNNFGLATLPVNNR
jgi:hypothetical protein